ILHQEDCAISRLAFVWLRLPGRFEPHFFPKRPDGVRVIVGVEYRKFKRPFRAVCGVAGGGTRVGLGVSWALSRGLWAG
ncbi:hypothetical protein B1R29_12120, partial [Pseudomonas aeruginosa]